MWRDVNGWIPPKLDNMTAMTQSENLQFLQPLLPVLTVVALFRLSSNAREADLYQWGKHEA